MVGWQQKQATAQQKPTPKADSTAGARRDVAQQPKQRPSERWPESRATISFSSGQRETACCTARVCKSGSKGSKAVKLKGVRKKLAPDETETKWEGVSVFQQTVGCHRPVS